MSATSPNASSLAVCDAPAHKVAGEFTTMVSAQAAEKFLSSSWLAEMELDARREVLNLLEEHHAEKGTILLEPSRTNDRIAFLIDGTVKVTVTGLRDRTEDIINIQAPSMFGLTTFFRSAAPAFTAKAATSVWYLTLDRAAHEQMRRENPRTAEQLALAAVHVLADRIDILDKRIWDDLAEHPDDHPKVTEWSSFRSRLFEDSVL